MTREARERMVMEKELSDILAAAKSHEEALELLKQNMATEQEKMRATVERYEVKRRELFDKELTVRGVAWCTLCQVLFPKGEAKILLLEGTRENSGGQEGACYGFEKYSNLHRVCPACYDKAFDQHGSRVGKTEFFAFVVENREVGYWAKRFGTWEMLYPGKHKFPELSEPWLSKLTSMWSLPPRVELDYKLGESKVVVYEPVRKTSAVDDLGQTASGEA
jgi:hypothetical protein